MWDSVVPGGLDLKTKYDGTPMHTKLPINGECNVNERRGTEVSLSKRNKSSQLNLLWLPYQRGPLRKLRIWNATHTAKLGRNLPMAPTGKASGRFIFAAKVQSSGAIAVSFRLSAFMPYLKTTCQVWCSSDVEWRERFELLVQLLTPPIWIREGPGHQLSLPRFYVNFNCPSRQTSR